MEEKKADAKKLILSVLQKTDPLAVESIYLELGRSVPLAALRECLSELHVQHQVWTYNDLYHIGSQAGSESIELNPKMFVLEYLLYDTSGSMRPADLTITLRGTQITRRLKTPVVRACLRDMLPSPRPKDPSRSNEFVFDGSVEFSDGLYCVNFKVAQRAIWTAAARRLGGDKAVIVVDKSEAKSIIIALLRHGKGSHGTPGPAKRRACSPMNVEEMYQELKATIPHTVLRACLREMVNPNDNLHSVLGWNLSVSNGFYFIDCLETQQSIRSGQRAVAATGGNSRVSIFLMLHPSIFTEVLTFLQPSERIIASGTDNLLRHMVFRANPLMWAKLKFSNIADKCLNEDRSVRLTDDTLRSFLLNINAAGTTKMISLAGCKLIKGSGLDALKGSTVLEEIDCRCDGGIFDEAKVISVLETMPPFANEGSSAHFSLRKVEFNRVRHGSSLPFVDRFHEPVRSFLLRFKACLGSQIMVNQTPCGTCCSALVNKCSEAELKAEPGKVRCSSCESFSCGSGTCPKINFCPMCNCSPCSECEDMISCQKCSRSCQNCGSLRSCVDCKKILCEDCNEDEEDRRIRCCSGGCEGEYCDRCRFTQPCDRCEQSFCTICRPLDDWKACVRCNEFMSCRDCTSDYVIYHECQGCNTDCCIACRDNDGIICGGDCKGFFCEQCLQSDQVRRCDQCDDWYCSSCVTGTGSDGCNECSEALLRSQKTENA